MNLKNQSCSDRGLVIPVSKDDSVGALARFSSRTAREAVPKEVAIKYGILPVSLISESEDSKLLTVFSAEALSSEKVKELRFIASADIHAEVIERLELSHSIELAYSASEEALASSSLAANAARKVVPTKVDTVFDASGEIPELLERIIKRARLLDASDIHITPREQQYEVFMRCHGQLRREENVTLDKEAGFSIIRRLKVLSSLDVSCSHRPQDGSCSFKFQGEEIRARISIVPSVFGEKAVLRFFRISSNHRNSVHQQTATFSHLGMSVAESNALEKALSATSGAILSVGPTGSGKSTLLHSCIDYLNDGWRNIVTIEDPVEEILTGVTQFEVNADKNIGFQELLPSLLRQDPDVIMVGEIRDGATAKTALSAGITGHLVLSTMHVSNCLEVFTRLREFAITPELQVLSLRLIIAQRLVPTPCNHCRLVEQPSSELLKQFQLSSDTTVVVSPGCSSCHNTGIAGRTGVFEFLPISEKISSCVLNNQFERLAELAVDSGYRPISYSIRDLLLEQKICIRQAARAIGLSWLL